MGRIVRLSAPTWRTRSPRARSSNGRPRSSRSSSRTPSTPGRAASSIHVELGGKKQVRVEDDGEGMEPEDARLAIERHATSKIRRADDLAAIRDAGIPRRGAAVDGVGLAFRAANAARGADESGTEIRVNGGARRVGRWRWRRREGTSSRSTTSSTTCRRGGSSSSRTRAESAQVSRVTTQLALAYPEIGFTLTSAGRSVLQCPPAASLRDRLYQLYGERDDLLEVRKEAGGLRLTGFVAALAEQGPTRGPQNVFINRRIVKDRTIAHAIIDAVQRRVDQGAEPGGAPVHRDAARRGRRQRSPDEGGSPVPGSVAGARGRAARADGRARPGRGAAASAAA